jgi:ribosomal protein S5
MARNQNHSDESKDGIREKMVAVNRVTKVVKGGRLFRICGSGSGW